MSQNKILLYIIIAVVAMYLGLQLVGYEDNANLVRPLIVPLLTVLYLVSKSIHKSVYFFIFLLLYSIRELMDYLAGFVPNDVSYFYSNAFNMVAYVFLIFEILSNVNKEAFFKKNIFQIIILFALNIFCVKYLTDLTGFVSNDELYFEFLYNVIIMFMISIALLNFFSRMTKKSMYLLIGTFCLVAGEMLVVAYYYVDNNIIFSNSSSILFILGLNFVFKQAYHEHQEFRFLEQVKAT